MKLTLLFMGCLLSLLANAQVKPTVQQKTNTFHLTDSLSGKPMVVSVAIFRANLFITTEPDGIFVIPGDLSKMRDTIVFSAQNYQSVTMPLQGLTGLDTIKLIKQVILKTTGNIDFKNDTLLNDFDRDNVAYYAGLSTPTADFDYKQVAQKFTVNKAGVSLKAAKIIRLAFNWTDGMYAARYRLRIYDIDPKTGGPGRDLCDQEIVVKSGGRQHQNSVDLKKYNVIVPNKTFFIAVEWMRDWQNAGESNYWDWKQKKNVMKRIYQPAIGLSPIKGDHLNIWALTIKNQWKPYTYFMPFGTDLAIKATIEY